MKCRIFVFFFALSLLTTLFSVSVLASREDGQEADEVPCANIAGIKAAISSADTTRAALPKCS